MKKRYGQHFITDRNLLQRIVSLAKLGPSDAVLEIGPGAGSLTRELAAHAAHVTAVEIDSDLIPRLRETMPSNVTVVEGDALSFEFGSLPSRPVHVVGNLPYNVATPLLQRLLADRASILDITVMLQKEVAARICAAPGTPDYGPLSVLVQYYAAPKLGFVVAPGAFTPRPKVDSAVIRLDWKVNVQQAEGFTNFAHRAFGSRRKTLLNNLMTIYPGRSREELASVLDHEDIARDARPEVVTVEQFLRIYNRTA